MSMSEWYEEQERNWVKMQSIGIRLATEDERADKDYCSYCRFYDSGQKCLYHKVGVNKAFWICKHYQR